MPRRCSDGPIHRLHSNTNLRPQSSWGSATFGSGVRVRTGGIEADRGFTPSVPAAIEIADIGQGASCTTSSRLNVFRFLLHNLYSTIRICVRQILLVSNHEGGGRCHGSRASRRLTCAARPIGLTLCR